MHVFCAVGCVDLLYLGVWFVVLVGFCTCVLTALVSVSGLYIFFVFFLVYVSLFVSLLCVSCLFSCFSVLCVLFIFVCFLWSLPILFFAIMYLLL